MIVKMQGTRFEGANTTVPRQPVLALFLQVPFRQQNIAHTLIAVPDSVPFLGRAERVLPAGLPEYWRHTAQQSHVT